MKQKTYSQKVARIFEIVDYILLAPAGIGALVGMALLLSGQIPYAFLLFVFLAIGIILLVGYFKHSRGRLDEESVGMLWLTTVIYNSLLLLPFLFWAASILQGDGLRGYEGRLDGGKLAGFLILLGIISGYLSAIILAIRAFSFEKRKKIV